MAIRELPAVSVVRATCEEEIQEAKRLELELFRDAGYVEYQGGEELEEHVPYNASSVFYIAVDAGKIVGVLRKIHYSSAGFATFNDFAVDQRWADLLLEQAKLGLVEEIGSGVVAEEYRAVQGFAVLRGLLRAAWQDSVTRGTRWWIARIDHRVVRLIRGLFRWDMKQLAAPEFYMGSLTESFFIDLHKEALTLWEKAPEVADYLFRGMDREMIETVLYQARGSQEVGPGPVQ